MATEVVGVLDRITASLVVRADRRDDRVRVLRQALGYGWSVAIAAAPDPGKRAFDRWIESPDADARWIVRENLGKARVVRLDLVWAARAAERVTRSEA